MANANACILSTLFLRNGNAHLSFLKLDLTIRELQESKQSDVEVSESVMEDK